MKKWLKRLLKIAAIAIPLLLLIIWFNFWSLMLGMMENSAAPAEIQVTHIAGTVYMLDAVLKGRQAGPSVLASVGRDGILLVDSTTASVLAEKVNTALAEIPAGEGRTLINTHAHPDHVLGNGVLGASGKRLAHHNTRQRLAEPAKPFKWLPAVPPFPDESLPQETVNHRQTMQWNGEEVVLLPLGPAHTDGDLAVYFTASKVVHVGDLFNGRGGRSVADYGYGGNLDGLAAALAELAQALPEDVRVVGGHGGVGAVYSRDDLVAYQAILAEMLTLLRQRIEAGKTVEEVLAEDLTARWSDFFGAARDDSIMHNAQPTGWVKALYNTLANES